MAGFGPQMSSLTSLSQVSCTFLGAHQPCLRHGDASEPLDTGRDDARDLARGRKVSDQLCLLLTLPPNSMRLGPRLGTCEPCKFVQLNIFRFRRKCHAHPSPQGQNSSTSRQNCANPSIGYQNRQPKCAYSGPNAASGNRQADSRGAQFRWKELREVGVNQIRCCGECGGEDSKYQNGYSGRRLSPKILG